MEFSVGTICYYRPNSNQGNGPGWCQEHGDTSVTGEKVVVTRCPNTDDDYVVGYFVIDEDRKDFWLHQSCLVPVSRQRYVAINPVNEPEGL